MKWDRLGIITDEVSDNLQEALDWAVRQKLKHVEIRTVHGKNIMDLDGREVIEMRHQVEAKGLYISALSSPVFKCALDPTRPVSSGDRFGQKEESVEEHFKKLEKAMDIAEQLSVSRIRIFSFWREIEPEAYQEEIVHHLRKAASMAENRKLSLLLENEPSCNGGFASEIGKMIQAVNSPALRALWDPGNEEYGGRPSFPQGYASVKGRIGHVHLKDAAIGEDDRPSCVPIGSGQVPFIRQLKELDKDGYSGLFTIETHYRPKGGTALDGSTETVEGLRTLLRETGEIMEE